MLTKLVHKYWLGETNREEEQLLRKLLQQEEVTGEMAKLKALFKYYEQEKSILSPHPVTNKAFQPTRTHPFRLYLMGIAASLLLALGVYLGWNHIHMDTSPEQALYADTYEDPELAYEETKKALQMISAKMNHGKTKSEKKLRKVSRLRVLIGTEDN